MRTTCATCNKPLDCTNKTYCKSCQCAKARKAYAKHRAKKFKENDEVPKVKKIIVTIETDPEQAFCDDLIKRARERNINKKIRSSTRERILATNKETNYEEEVI